MSSMELLGLSLTTWLVVGVVCLFLWLTSRRPRGLPPGPAWCLPLVGHLPLMRRDPRDVFRELRLRYGDVFHLYLGSKLVVVLNGYDVIKEALVKHGDVFSDRPHGFITDMISQNMGVAGSSGTNWKEQRKFALGALREFGFGRNMLQDKIMEEVLYLTEAFKDEGGQAFDSQYKIMTSVSNVICNIVFGKRFDYGDPLFASFLERMRENIDSIGNTAVINTFPLVRFLPGDPFKYKRVLDNVHFVERTFVEPAVREHLDRYNPSNPNMDFIDAYIREMKKVEAEGKPSTINVENLVKTIGDLFVAGSDTTSTTLQWSILIFLNHPDIQDKVFDEIQAKVGPGRAARLEDKASLPYVEAFIQEVLRFANIAPLGVPHATSTQVVFRGFCLPQATEVFTNLDSVLHDPALWDSPEQFRPERFLKDGQLLKREELIPFSIGRRVCLGEALARMEIFLFLVTLVQRFRFVCEDGSDPPKLEGVLGLVYSPKPYKVKAIPRF